MIGVGFRVTKGVTLFSPHGRGESIQRGVFSPSTTHPAGSSSSLHYWPPIGRNEGIFSIADL